MKERKKDEDDVYIRFCVRASLPNPPTLLLSLFFESSLKKCVCVLRSLCSFVVFFFPKKRVRFFVVLVFIFLRFRFMENILHVHVFFLSFHSFGYIQYM